MSGSGLLPCKLTPEPPFRRAKIPAVIAPLQSIIRTAQNLGGGNATARFHQGNCWLGGNLAAFGARAATGQLPLIGFLGATTPALASERVAAFTQRLKE